jgi:MFS family permease
LWPSPLAIGSSSPAPSWSEWDGLQPVAATAVIADATRTFERGRAIGANDTASAAATIALPLLAGPAVELFGLPALGILGAGLMVPPFMLLLTRLKETSESAREAG